MANSLENVLVLQGGGSLGAFGCGVFKALVNNNIKLDIVAGTSIGSLNAAIIAGSKGDHPEQNLEQFWLELADGNNNRLCSGIHSPNFHFIALHFMEMKRSLSQGGAWQIILKIHNIFHLTNGPIFMITLL